MCEKKNGKQQIFLPGVMEMCGRLPFDSLGHALSGILTEKLGRHKSQSRLRSGGGNKVSGNGSREHNHRRQRQGPALLSRGGRKFVTQNPPPRGEKPAARRNSHVLVSPRDEILQVIQQGGTSAAGLHQV